MRVPRIDTGERRVRISTGAGSGEKIRDSRRGVDDRPKLMVVPPVGIVIHNDHRSAFPFGLLLQEVEQGYYEGLLVKRVGVAGMAVLVSCRLDEVHSREIAGANRSIEVLQVVLMIGRARLADFRHRRRTSVTGIGRR